MCFKAGVNSILFDILWDEYKCIPSAKSIVWYMSVKGIDWDSTTIATISLSVFRKSFLFSNSFNSLF
jgi:hypothetical protein